MDSALIKAARMQTPEGVPFIAFFDFDGRLCSRDNAIRFVEMIALIVGVPVSIKYQDMHLQGEWRTFSYREDCCKSAAAAPIRDVRVGAVVLSVPNWPPEEASQ